MRGRGCQSQLSWQSPRVRSTWDAGEHKMDRLILTQVQMNETTFQ